MDDALEAHEEVVLTQLFRKAIDVIEADPSNRGPTRLIINLPAASAADTSSISQEDFTRFQDFVQRFNAASQRALSEAQAELAILRSKAEERPRAAPADWLRMAGAIALSVGVTLGISPSNKSSSPASLNVATTGPRIHDVAKEVTVVKELMDDLKATAVTRVEVDVSEDGSSVCRRKDRSCLSVHAIDDKKRPFQIACDTTIATDLNCELEPSISARGFLFSVTDKRPLLVRTSCLASTPVAICARN